VEKLIGWRAFLFACKTMPKFILCELRWLFLYLICAERRKLLAT